MGGDSIPVSSMPPAQFLSFKAPRLRLVPKTALRQEGVGGGGVEHPRGCAECRREEVLRCCTIPGISVPSMKESPHKPQELLCKAPGMEQHCSWSRAGGGTSAPQLLVNNGLSSGRQVGGWKMEGCCPGNEEGFLLWAATAIKLFLLMVPKTTQHVYQNFSENYFHLTPRVCWVGSSPFATGLSPVGLWNSTAPICSRTHLEIQPCP